MRTALALPDPAAHLRRPDHPVASLASECFLEFGHIRKRADGAELAQWVRVGVHHQPGVFRAYIRVPHLRPREKESLLRSKAVDRRGPRLALQRLLECTEGNGQPPEVGDAFAFHELALFVQPRLDLKSIELLHDAFAPPGEKRSFRVTFRRAVSLI